MKNVRKILPLSIYDIPGIESWLEEQANAGLFPVYLDSWVTFTHDGAPGTRFRLEPWGKAGDTPTQDQLELYRQAGWKYALTVGSVYYLFYTTDPNAVELYSDANSRGLSLERLEQRIQRSHRLRIVFYTLLAAAVVWALFFFKSKYDVQPDKLARLPLLLVSLFNPVLLLYFALALFSWHQSRRDLRILQSTCHALKEDLTPPPSPGPSKKIVRKNLFMLALIPPLFVLLMTQVVHYNPFEDLPLQNFDRPYVELQSLEQEPVLPWEELFDEPPFLRDEAENVAEVKFSLLSPTWYSVEQDGYSPQGGKQSNVFSPKPEDGNCYAPNLDMTCFSLLIPALARPVAMAQLDEYRLVNLRWSYEETSFPGLDFVILADEPEGVWQMAALGKGRRVAVFRYAGVEHLSDHLEQLADMVW